MRWKSGRRSQNVEDQRGVSSAGIGGAGLLLRFLPILLKTKIGRSLLGVGLVVFFGAKFIGVDFSPALLSGAKTTSTEQSIPEHERVLGDFVSVVLADTESTWHSIFQQINRQYVEPKLVLFSGSVNSACGRAGASMGPFYCPADQKVYIDLSFYSDLKKRHNAPGDFAQAYVIAHEVGHHVQTLLGISNKVHSKKATVGKTEGNALSVRQELQADCFAGLWAHSANINRALLEAGDLEEALVAASAIGDDRLQKQARGRVVPESFTHGSSAQRVKWFKKGFNTGQLSQCDTFSIANP